MGPNLETKLAAALPGLLIRAAAAISDRKAVAVVERDAVDYAAAIDLECGTAGALVMISSSDAAPLQLVTAPDGGAWAALDGKDRRWYVMVSGSTVTVFPADRVGQPDCAITRADLPAAWQ